MTIPDEGLSGLRPASPRGAAGARTAGRAPAQRVPAVLAVTEAALQRGRLLERARARLRVVELLRVEQQVILEHSARALAASSVLLTRSGDRPGAHQPGP